MTPAAQNSIEPASPAPASHWSWRDWLLLALVLGIAAWIRFTHVDSGLSFDELWHLASTTGNPSAMDHFRHDVVYPDAPSLTSLEHERSVFRIWSSMDGILHPPLFIIALRMWREVWGSGELAAHGFSIFCGLVSIGFTFASARLAFDRIAAALAGLALAFAQTQVYLSQEVRAYAMLTALAAVALWLLTRIVILGPTTRRVVMLGLLTLPIQLTHYFAFGACLAIGIAGLALSRGHRRAFLASVGASAVFFLATWLPFALRQLDDLDTGDSFLKLDRGVAHVLLLAAGMPFRLIAERDYEFELTPVFSGVLFFVPWLLVKRFRVMLPWAIWLGACVLPMTVLDLTRTTVHVAYVRYFAVATPAVPLLVIGVIWAFGQRRLAYAGGAILCLVGGIYLFSGNTVPLDADDFTDVVRVIEPRIRPGDAIVTYSGDNPKYHGDAVMLTLSNSPMFEGRTVAVLTRPMTPEMVQQLGTRSVWLASGVMDMPVEQLIPGARSDFGRAATVSIYVSHVVIDSPPATAPAVPAETTGASAGLSPDSSGDATPSR